jgi:hypothetical protein
LEEKPEGLEEEGDIAADYLVALLDITVLELYPPRLSWHLRIEF